MPSIRITSIPPGEAPAAIRAAWVGLELPLKRSKPQRYLGSGVLSGPRNGIQTLLHMITLRLKVHTGFVVPALSAIEILEGAVSKRGQSWAV